MKLPEFAKTISDGSGASEKATAAVLRKTFRHMLAELEANEQVKIPGLGRFVKRTDKKGKARIRFIPRKPGGKTKEL